MIKLSIKPIKLIKFTIKLKYSYLIKNSKK